MPFVPDPLKPRLRNAVLHAALRSARGTALRTALSAALCAATGTSLVLSVSAQAAVMGDARVRSYLGQKLDAEIEISSLTAAESEALLVRIPAAHAFAAAGIDMTALVRSLRVTLEKRGEQTFVRLSSDQAIAEPFLMVLVELNAGGTRTMRQYALLIDPAPVDRPQQAGNVEPAIAEAQSQDGKGAAPADARASSDVANTAGSPANAANAAAPSPSTNAATGDARLRATTSRRVRKGDTLAAIGNEVKPDGIRLEQVMVALQRANPQAFEGNNINRMKSGSVLSVPSIDAMRDIDATAARRIVIAQSADFQRYREALAERMNIPAANSANAGNGPSAAAAGNRSSSGTVGVTVKEPGAHPEPQNQLKLTAPGQASGNAAGKSAANASGANDRKTLDQIAADKALADANSRIAALEKNLSQMAQMLELRDRKLADAQKSAELAAREVRGAKGASDAATRDNAPANPPAATSVAPSAPAAAEPAATPATPAATSTEPSAPAAKAGKPVPAAKSPAPVPAAGASVSWIDVLNDPIARAAAAGAALLVLAGLLLRVRRANGDKQGRRGKRSKVNLVGSATATSSASAAAADAANAADTDAARAPETAAPGATPPGTTPTAPVLAAVKADPQSEAKAAGKAAASEVDAIAEADVYIAYGRTEQAEEILRDALNEHPQRHPLRVKLLEIYASRRDRKAFGELANELCVLTGGKGSAWEQAAHMGQMLDPGNPLYGSLPQAMDTRAPRNAPAALPAVPPAGKDGGRPSAGSSSGSSVEDFGLKLEGLLDEQRREQGKPPAPMQSSAASAIPDFSLSGIGRSEAGSRRIEPTLSGEPDHAALTTKLDLAQACEEIGDHEGARELLAEVAAARDPELSRRAQDLLRKLA